MWRSFLGFGVGLSLGLALVATGQDAAKPAAPAAAKTPEAAAAEKCANDLPQWQAYANQLKTSRDALEQDVATLRADVARLQPKPAK